MKRIFKNTYKIVFIIAAVFLVFLSVIGGIGGNAYAAFADSGYTNVLDDLNKDSSFNPDDYPPAQDDKYSLQVIQIAESTNKELLIYVYQPTANIKPLVATKINMLLTADFSEYDYDDNIDGGNDNDGNNNGWGGSSGGGHGGGGGSFHSASVAVDEPVTTALYDLTLLNRDSVFAKYKVSNFKVSSDEVRYYNITSIYRAYDETLGDTGSSPESIIKEVAFPVGKLYTVRTENNNLIYDCVKREVVTILNPYADYLRFSNGWKWYYTSCDVHYVAFSTDWDMDSIISADISFKHRSVIEYALAGSSYGKWQDKKVTIYETDTASNPVGLYNGDSHTWNRIDTVENFINENQNNLKASTKNELRKDKWVFCFYETEYVSVATTRYTQVGEVAILRLEFRVGDKVYNLGAVSDLVSEDEVPGNKNTGSSSLWEMFIDFCKFLEKHTNVSYIMWTILFIAVPVLVVLVVLSAVFPPVWGVVKIVLKAIGTGLLWVLKGLWWLICLPFKGLMRLIKKE